MTGSDDLMTGENSASSPCRGPSTLHAYFPTKDTSMDADIKTDPKQITSTPSRGSGTISPKEGVQEKHTPSVVSKLGSTSLKRKAQMALSSRENTRRKTPISSKSVSRRNEESASDRASAQTNSAKKKKKKKQAKKKPGSTTSQASTHPPPLSASSGDRNTSTAQLSVVASLRQEIARSKENLDAARETETFLRRQVEALTKKVEEAKSHISKQQSNAAKVFEQVMRDNARRDALKAREMLANDSVRLGKVVVMKTSSLRGVSEMWRDGNAFKEVHSKMASLIERRESLEKEKRAMMREASKARRKRRLEAESAAGTAPPAGKEWSPSFEQSEREAVVKAALNQLKKEEESISEERKRLESEKKLHIRELKRIRDEEQSRFNKLPVLNNRYLLMKLLGKGGFSEVWEAFDLIEYRKVACKIHQLNTHWSDEKKQNYTKHATREYAIHKSVRHHRVVRLYDVFEIDMVSFATVLECCKGPDLDYYLKEMKVLPEREARAILIQILSALNYLNNRPHPIIHYDLKPGNILFDGAANVKITDFGLSKIVDTDASGATSTHGIELTSQGAGTYWYLPPECFRTGPTPPTISSRVDVWSCGVIFYQMLFGRRPFGHGMSQDNVLREHTILNAKAVVFPTDKVKVSDGAKDFIRKCLEYHAHQRPSVSKICEHPYLRKRM